MINTDVEKALCTAYNKSWTEVSDELYGLAKDKFSMIDNDEVYKDFLNIHNASYIKTKELNKKEGVFPFFLFFIFIDL